MKRHIDWLTRELPALQNMGLLDEKTAQRIQEHYRTHSSTPKNWAIIIFSILGSLLIGLGVILLFAHNWKYLSRLERAILSFLPLLFSLGLCGWTLWRKEHSASWKESCGTSLMLSIGACIALIAQTYHLPGDAGAFMLTWMLLSILIPYILGATLPALFFLVGITCWAGFEQIAGGYAIYYWLLFSLVLPYFFQLRKNTAYALPLIALSWTMALTACGGLGISLEKNCPGLWIIIYAGYLSAFYLFGKEQAAEYKAPYHRPFFLIGSFGIVILTLILTYEWPWEEIGWQYYRHVSWAHETIGFADYMLLTIILLVVIFLNLQALRRQRYNSLLFGLFPLPAIIGFCVVARSETIVIALALMNLYLFMLGIGTLIKGIRAQRLRWVNGGLFIFSALIVARFTDAELSFLLRSFCFIILGIAFLAANLIINRKKSYLMKKIGFIFMALIQILIPGWMIHHREMTLKYGTLYEFKTKPVDPYDLFRGRYVSLAIENHAPLVEKNDIRRNSRVYALLQTDENGFATFSHVTFRKPDTENYLKTKVKYTQNNKIVLQIPFNRFYMDEFDAPEAESIYRKHSARDKGKAWVAVRIKDGYSVIEDLYIENQPIRDFLRDYAR